MTLANAWASSLVPAPGTGRVSVMAGVAFFFFVSCFLASLLSCFCWAGLRWEICVSPDHTGSIFDQRAARINPATANRVRCDPHFSQDQVGLAFGILISPLVLKFQVRAGSIPEE